MNSESIKTNRLLRHWYFFAKSVFSYKRLHTLATLKFSKYIEDGRIPANLDKDKTVQDMLSMYKKYGYGFEEYLGFRFFEKDIQTRLSFVADWEHFGYSDKMNKYENAPIFDNKALTYKKFKPFYKRELLLIRSSNNTDADRFMQFQKAHPDYVCKPVKAACGEGFQISPGKKGKTFDNLITEFSGSFIVEELIVQDERLAAFHPQSVNTLRIPTIRFDDETIVLHPLLRLGQHGSNVDNAGAGGILCIIDNETGVIISAADKSGKQYDLHPDTGKKITGFNIPLWDEAISLAKKLAQVVPENRYTGWDLALTKSGWIMVEGNRRGQIGWQHLTQIGARSEINGYLSRLNLKY